jgi:hypothetical protein
MRRLLRPALLIVVVVLVGIQFVPISNTAPPIDPAQTLERQVAVPANVKAILDRSCRDCHSNETSWPLYARIAPFSWLLASHVRQGREDMNLSEWGQYDAGAARDILVEVCRQVKKGAMPKWSYALVHRSAALSSADVTTLCTWSDTTRKAIQAAE